MVEIELLTFEIIIGVSIDISKFYLSFGNEWGFL